MDKAQVAPPRRMPDPYLLWAELTGYRYLAATEPGLIRVAGCLLPGASLQQLDAIAGLHRMATPDHDAASFFSARLERPLLQRMEDLTALADVVLAQPGLQPFGASPFDTLPSPLARADPRSPSVLHAKVVVGIIDGRCAIANQRFCRADDPISSRIGYFWDQGSAPGGDWQAPAGFDYGRELTARTLDKAMARHLSVDGIGFSGTRAEAERWLYHALGQALPGDADWSHGTHVLDTLLSDFDADTPAAAAESDGSLGVIYVQLPDIALRDTSAHWTASYVLDALHYILARAGDAPVVVNLSLGAFAGPHDGSSLLERAIDRLIEDRAGKLHVVVAAGNARRVVDDGTGEPVRCRARFDLPPAGKEPGTAGAAALLVWDIHAADDTDSFLELWSPDVGAEGGLLVSLRHEDTPAEAEQVLTARPGDIVPLPVQGQAVAAVVNATGPFQAPNGKGGMVLVALGHTRDATGAGARQGRWRVSVANLGAEPIVVDACVERRDVPGELPGERPQYGLTLETAGDHAGDDSASSLGSMANGNRTIVVGAVDPDRLDREIEPSRSSSLGPAQPSHSDGVLRRIQHVGPDACCIGKREATGFLTGSYKELEGTSVAAAQFAAAVARELIDGGRAAGKRAILERMKSRAAQRELDRQAQLGPTSGGGSIVKPGHPGSGASNQGPVEAPPVRGAGFLLAPPKRR